MKSNKDMYIQYLHVAVMLAFLFGFRYLPPIGSVTPLGMQVLGIFAGIVYGWSFLDLVWTSFLGLVALSLLPGVNAIDTFKTGFGDRLTVALFMFLLFGELIKKVGLSKYIADWCISRKFIQGKPYGIMIMFCLAGSIISAFVNIFAGIILMWNVFTDFCKEVDLKPKDTYAQVTLIAIIYTASMAGVILPFMSVALLVTGLQESILNISVAYVPYVIAQIVMMLLASLIYFGFVKFVIKPDVSQIKIFHRKQDQALHMTGQQKFLLGLTGVLMLMLFLPGILPQDIFVIKLMKGLDLAGSLAAIFVIYYIVNVNNEKAIPFSEIAKGINWGLILMFAAIAPLTAAVSNPDSGIIAYLNVILETFFNDMNPYLFIIIILLVGSIITQFCNNAAVILMIMPVMYTFSQQIGINPSVLCALAAFNLNIAFCTPAASGPAALVFSNKTWIDTKIAYKHGVLIFVINMLITIIGIPIAEILFS